MPEPRVPTGYKDEAEFIAEARELFQMDVDADRINREAALDDLKFACDYGSGAGKPGAQWDSAVVASRAGRPCLTTNVLPQYIGQIIGDNRINRPAIKVRPAEDADEDLAEIRAGLIRSIEYQSGAQGIYTQALQAQATCGVGHFRCGLDYADDETFLRELRIKPVADPLSVVWDCLSVERTGRDAKRCFISDEMPRKEFERRWKGKVPGGLVPDTPALMTGSWVTRDTVRVTEYWRMEEEKRTIAQIANGEVTDITDEKGSAALNVKEQRTVTRLRACMYLITGFAILEGPYHVPIDRIPVFRCFGQVYQVGNDRVWFGLVRFMKDEQRLQNYADSVIAETLALAPKAQWLADTVAVEGREENIRNAHRSGDPLLVMNQGGQMQRIDPPVFPVALLQWRQTLTQAMKDVSGLHDASLGIQSNETSGKAIMARQREGDVATIVYHDNLNAAIGECGRVLNQLIPVVYDTARTLRIIGEDESAKVVKVNDADAEDGHIDMSQGKYDIVVETGPSYSTKRVEAAESMISFVQAYPDAAAVTGDLIAHAQDWPEADKFADRLKALLPPQLQDQKDPSEMTPEEQAEAQQAQAQQIAQQAQQQALQDTTVQLEIEKARAEIAKLQAEARKIATEAAAPEQAEPAEDPRLAEAEVRKAMAAAMQAEADATAARFRAREAEAKAQIAEQQARRAQTDADFNDVDTLSRLETGRGVVDPEPPATGNGKTAT